MGLSTLLVYLGLVSTENQLDVYRPLPRHIFARKENQAIFIEAFDENRKQMWRQQSPFDLRSTASDRKYGSPDTIWVNDNLSEIVPSINFKVDANNDLTMNLTSLSHAQYSLKFESSGTHCLPIEEGIVGSFIDFHSFYDSSNQTRLLLLYNLVLDPLPVRCLKWRYNCMSEF